jgi:hypothetical protein
MPRYLIERTFDEMDEDELSALGQRSADIIRADFPEIKWEHSHVVVDTEGTVKSFCVYFGPDEDTVRKHAKMLGRHQLGAIYEIGGDISPSDFPPVS